MAGRQSQKRTIKHDLIKHWAEARHGRPALVKTTQDALRIKIGEDETQQEPITWERWFEIFDDKQFAFVFEDPGYTSKVVARNGLEDTPEATEKPTSP